MGLAMSMACMHADQAPGLRRAWQSPTGVGRPVGRSEKSLELHGAVGALAPPETRQWRAWEALCLADSDEEA